MEMSESKVETKDAPHGTTEGLRYRVTVGSSTNDKNDDDNEAINRSEEKIELFGEYREPTLHGNERQVGCPCINETEETTEMSNNESGIGTLAHNAAEEFVRKVWKNCHFRALPQWLQDNDFLHDNHRPPLNSFWACFKSIFRVHTETVNIWTHLLGCIGFMGIAVYFLTRSSNEIKAQEKLIFMLYFAGTIICLGLSSAFHTLHCHSEWVGKLFNKLDYCGIAVLIMVSFVPWLYYGFYCHLYSKIAYTVIVLVLGLTSIIVSLWEKFSQPQLRPLRTSVFIVFGLSGVVPAIHYVFVEGWFNKIALASLGWLSLMGSLYIIGALIYVMRIPERFFPGKCDIWFQSHQIFHIFVIAAAFVHYHNITKMAMYRISVGECPDSPAF